MSDHKKSGLDIDLGNLCSKDAYSWAKKTFRNREGRPGAPALNLDGAFSNLLIFGDQRIGIASDGIGTKIELAERTGIFDTLGYDLVAMVADDLATAGFEPASISNIIDVDHLDRQVINDLMRGLAEACDFSAISISGGEIAELGNRICGYGEGMHFNWCSTAIGYLSEKMAAPIDGSKVKAGQVVISLQSRGFRSNGFSLVRRIMVENYGENWHKEKYDEQLTWGEILLTPSLIYTPIINALIESGLAPAGIAHITGGGILENFERVLKMNGLGVVFDNIFEPLPVMRRLQELGKVPDEDAYLYWNMGNGMFLVVEEEQVEETLKKAAALKYPARIAGKISEGRKLSIQMDTLKLKKEY